jgi:hypothetical protein
MQASSRTFEYAGGDLQTTLGIGDSHFFCPFVEFNDLEKDDVSTLYVYLHDDADDGPVEARACVSSLGSSSVSCGSWVDNGDDDETGDETLTPSLSSWSATSAGIAWVEIILPGGSDSYIEGIYTAS